MDRQLRGPFLIHTRRGALIALSVAILLELKDLRYLFEIYVPGHTSWLTRYRFQPTEYDLILAVACSVLFAGALIFILRRAVGGERIYLAIFVGTVVLGPLSDIPAIASMHPLAWTAAVGELGLIASAVWMYRTLPKMASPTEDVKLGSPAKR
jgi:hypothetical protein